MNGYYYVINTLKDYLKNNGFTKTVTVGNIFDVDLEKQTIFPLNHIIVNGATLTENMLSLNVSVLLMDIVEDSKNEVEDLWLGNDTTQDVLNTQLALANRMVSDMLRGDLYADLVRVPDTASCEPFTDRFENKVAGWTLTFDVQVPNDMSVC